MRKELLFGLFILFLDTYLSAQYTCIYYSYETLSLFSDPVFADAFEKDAAEMGIRNMYIRTSDTSFIEFYKDILKVSDGKRRWLRYFTQNMQPQSCNYAKEYNVFDGNLNYTLIGVDTIKDRPVSKYFYVIKRNDSIFYTLDGKKLQLRYSLKKDTVTTYAPIIEEFHKGPAKVQSYFLGKETGLLFGQPINILIFKEIYRDHEEILWYNEFNTVPIKIKFLDRITKQTYMETTLTAAFQF